MNDQFWNYLVTAVGLIGFYLSGKKIWWSWYVNIANQALWFTFGVVTEQWGFVVGTFFYTPVFVRNAYLWTKEHRESKPSGAIYGWTDRPNMSKKLRYFGWLYHCFNIRVHRNKTCTCYLVPRSKYPNLSFGFRLDNTQFREKIADVSRTMQKLSYSVNDAALTSKLYGLNLRPDRKTRWFGWITHWHSPIVHYRYRMCSCYRLKSAKRVGTVTKVEQAGDGLRVTGQIDATTKEGQAVWDLIKGPPGQYSIDESKEQDNAGKPELHSDTDPKRQGDGEQLPRRSGDC